MQLSLLTFFLQGLPETVAFTILIFAIARIQLRWKIITLIALVQALLAYVLRLLPIPFGVHTVVLSLFWVFYMVKCGKVSVLKGLYSTFFGIALVILYEFLTHFFYVGVLGLPLHDPSFKNSVVWIFLGWPHIILLFLTALGTNKVLGKLDITQGRPGSAF